MPASRQRSRSPFMAWAVMAMIGMCRPVACSLFANGGSCLEAVHLRHLHVHQHQVERLAGHASSASRPLFCHLNDMSALFEYAHGHSLIDDVVFREQDVEPWARLAREVVAELAEIS